jgi:5-formyltetrahydrofolate cyclo-ligase
VTERDARRADDEIRHRAKRALRNQMRAVRSALPESACDERSRAIVERLKTLDEVAQARVVLAFASIGNEVRTRTFIDAMHASGRTVALPRVTGDALSLHLVRPDDELSEGAFSVPEPPADAPLLAPGRVEFALVPALAVDPRGYRIGYGGGFYDRLLPTLENACACAVAYDFQLIPEVPNLAFDAAVDLVVTDERLIRAVV